MGMLGQVPGDASGHPFFLCAAGREIRVEYLTLKTSITTSQCSVVHDFPDKNLQSRHFHKVIPTSRCRNRPLQHPLELFQSVRNPSFVALANADAAGCVVEHHLQAANVKQIILMTSGVGTALQIEFPAPNDCAFDALKESGEMLGLLSDRTHS